MKPQKQRYRHRPEAGEFGDCHRTAIACLLDLDRDEVPNFGEHYGDTKAFFDAADAFLRSRGLATVDVPFAGTLESVLEHQSAVNSRAYYLLAGESRTGVNHTVIACGGEIVWDPSLDDAGIIGPCDDGHFWLSYLVPIAMVRLAAKEAA